jgi:predicted tellurium resistance membrane protein TerC
MEWITRPEAWVALLTLTVLEIVLGIDNIIFISILAGKLPHDQQSRARQVGLGLALITRVILLLSLTFIARLEHPLFTVLGFEITARDLVLLTGGLFLVAKATREIHTKLEGEEGHISARVQATFASVIIQIMLLDMVFSLDSVITAVGMANHVAVMITAVVIAVGIMLFASGPISDFVNQHPTIKMLALAFLLLIGVTLLVESLHVEIPKGYIYFAMGFSVFVELLNLRASARSKLNPVRLHQPVTAPSQASQIGATSDTPPAASPGG